MELWGQASGTDIDIFNRGQVEDLEQERIHHEVSKNSWDLISDARQSPLSAYIIVERR